MHVYVSPHLDDAALSCGGTIFQQTQAGEEVLVVNVFAGLPEYDQLSAFARAKHAVWGSPGDVVAARRAEDEAALSILGADAVYWAYGDAIYRVEGDRALYPSEAGIFGDVDPAEADLPAELADRVEAILDRWAGAICYAPLGIGHHVDHLIVREAGLVLAERGRRVWFYEDFPYVWWNLTDHPTKSEAVRDEGGTQMDTQLGLRLASRLPGEWASEIWPIAVDPKIRAIACYGPQVDDLFGGEETMAEIVRKYAESVGGDCAAERFWYPAGNPRLAFMCEG